MANVTLKMINEKIEEYKKEISISDILKMDMLDWQEQSRIRAIKELKGN